MMQHCMKVSHGYCRQSFQYMTLVQLSVIQPLRTYYVNLMVPPSRGSLINVLYFCSSLSLSVFSLSCFSKFLAAGNCYLSPHFLHLSEQLSNFWKEIEITLGVVQMCHVPMSRGSCCLYCKQWDTSPDKCMSVMALIPFVAQYARESFWKMCFYVCVFYCLCTQQTSNRVQFRVLWHLGDLR